MPLLDTNILVHQIRNDSLAKRLEARYALAKASPAPIISVVSEGEIRALALQFGWGPARMQSMEGLLNYFTIVPLPFSRIVAAYALIDDFSRRAGVTMGKNDLWIAATVHVTGERLLTTDKDFDHLDGVLLHRDWIDPAVL